MKLLDSLLDAIVRLEGDALVMHVGEKPYVITASSAMNAYRGPLAWGQVELSSRVLTFDAVSSMLAQILPPDQQRALDEFGAIEHEILPPDGILDRFTVVAARGGEDVWVEVRRKPVPPPAADAAPAPEFDVAQAAPETAAAQVAPETTAAAPAALEETEPEPVPTESAVPLPLVSEAETAVEIVGAEGPVQLEDHDSQAHTDTPETIVVALPGETSEEVSLNGVPDNAIQIIDEEQQDVPTEEEVDAMLAATASALLNSGLTVEDAAGSTEIHAHYDEPEVVTLVELPEAPPAETVEPTAVEFVSIELAPSDLEPVEPAAPEAPVVEPVAVQPIPVEAPPAEPAFELSPPPENVPEEAAVEASPELAPSFEIPAGTPLFTEDAARAAAAPPAAPEPVEEIPTAVAELPGTFEQEIQAEEIVVVTPAPEFEHPQVMMAETPSPAAVASDSHANRGAEAPAPPPAEVHPVPAEIHMDVTPELRQSEGIAQHDLQSDTRTGVVVPLSRSPIKTETIATPFTPAEDAALMRTLRVAAARGAGTVYVVAQSKPMIRVDGEIVPLESEPTLTAADVDRLVMELAPPRRRDALQNGPVEWLCDVPEIGRVRCLTFRDHRGPGVLFRMFPPRAISADQLGLTTEVQGLCQQSDGLVLVTGARASGKSTLLNAFVDSINRTRSDHVITIESQIGFVHESRRSFISQRETRGDAELAAAVTRAAVREDPDVMMVEELKSAELVSAALEAAESGRLVLASLPAASTIGALERLLEVLPADRRAKARTSLASSLRGVIAQVLLRRATGGRVAAREILLNTPAVSTLVLEGKMFQLPVALDSGRRHGMVPLTDSLAAHVREGTVQPAEAYRKALDRAALVAALKRDGVDTSFAERLA